MAATSQETVALYLIKVAGTDLDPVEANLVHQITVTDFLRLPDVCSLVVGYPARSQGNPFQDLDDTAFVIGAPLEVRLGSKDDMRTQPLFKGEIVTIEPSFEAGGVSLVVRAYDTSHRMLRTRRQRAFTNQTASDIVTRVCGEYGLSADTDSSGPPLDYVIQYNETDLDFIWRLASRIGFEFVIDESGASFRRPGSQGDPIELRYPEDLHSFAPRITSVQQVDAVNVRGFDLKTKEPVEVSASSPGQITEAGIRRADVNGKFGETSLEIAGQSFTSREEAQGIAQGTLDRLANAYLGADGSCPGDPRIKAGATLDVSGLGRNFSGVYRVTRAVHVLRGGGEYRTEFSDSPGEHLLSHQLSGNGSARPGGALVVGLVTSNDDPEKLGRVKVRLPAISDQETFWAPVAVPSAGDGRGLSMLPVPGEQVVVAFENGDPSYPYVLGSLFNGKDQPGDELAVADGSFALRSDHTALIAAKEAITLRSEEGNWLIRIQGGDIEETVNSGRGGQGRYTGNFDGGWSLHASQMIEIQSDMQITVKAPQIQLQATGPLQLQGNPVQIDGGSAVTVSGAVINLG